VGFGISTPDQVRKVARLADGVIVGSALIDAIGGLRGAAAANAAFRFVSSLRAAL
jgi:tryptophan synthase alpha chain